MTYRLDLVISLRLPNDSGNTPATSCYICYCCCSMSSPALPPAKARTAALSSTAPCISRLKSLRFEETVAGYSRISSDIAWYSRIQCSTGARAVREDVQRFVVCFFKFHTLLVDATRCDPRTWGPCEQTKQGLKRNFFGTLWYMMFDFLSCFLQTFVWGRLPSWFDKFDS